ncbi:MAG TPA: hypothetical protein VEJ45_07470 [Candidatus Acidoferrales bacterium]|nr:hypothetical protein [Candidatus Acidoferrales bacterium]
MKLLHWTRRFSRRGFLARGVAAVAAVATRGGRVVAETAAPGNLTAEEVRTLRKFTRDLFPHDRLHDSFYERAVKPLLEEAANDGATRQVLVLGVGRLNQWAHQLASKAYADVEDEEKRVAIVKRIEVDQSASAEFFHKVYSTTIVSLYNQPEVWPLFGYEGPSSAKGGYLHRGFNDLNWL